MATRDKPLAVLLVEDDEEDFLITRDMLAHQDRARFGDDWCQERYELAVRAANDGIWDWDLTTNRIYFAPRWHAILGHRERSGDADPAMWFDLVHEEDLLRLRAAIDAHLAGDTPYLQQRN